MQLNKLNSMFVDEFLYCIFDIFHELFVTLSLYTARVLSACSPSFSPAAQIENTFDFFNAVPYLVEDEDFIVSFPSTVESQSVSLVKAETCNTDDFYLGHSKDFLQVCPGFVRLSCVM